jgi:peptide/nickel transport system permease protein
MWAYIFRRMLQLIPTFLGATLLAFFIIQIAPGDFVTRLELDPSADRESIQRLREQFGLDQSLPVQYAKWLSGILTGYLGLSLSYQTDVWNVIDVRIANSMILVLSSTIIIFLFAIPIGVYSAVRKYSVGDRVLTVLAFIGLAVPGFFFGLIMLFLAVWLNDQVGTRVLPIGGMTSQTIDGMQFFEAPWYRRVIDIAWHALPVVTVLSLTGIAGTIRIMRGQMLDVLSQDYIRTARSKGLSERVTIYKHALRNAVIPIIAGIGFILPALVAGGGLIEQVMAWPGITPAFLEAIQATDIYVIMGLITITTFLLMIGNLVSDLLLAWVDPRIRYS